MHLAQNCRIKFVNIFEILGLTSCIRARTGYNVAYERYLTHVKFYQQLSIPRKVGETMENDHALSDLLQLFWQIRKTVQRSIQQADPGNSRGDIAMLERLHYVIRQSGQDGAVPVSALAERLRMLPPAVSRTLRQLEDNGLVERIHDPADHRRALVRLTEKGEQIRLQAEDRMRDYMHRVIDRVGEETFSRMLADLTTWEQAMQAELDQTPDVPAPESAQSKHSRAHEI